MKAKLARYSLCVCVMLATGSAFAQGACTLSTWKGDFIFEDSGTIPGVLSLASYASVGHLISNGDGTGVFSEETSTAGVIAPKEPGFNYQVVSDGTPTSCRYSVQTNDGRSFSLDLNPKGDSGFFISTGPETTIVGTLHKRS